MDPQWTQKNNGRPDVDPVITIELNRWIGVPVFSVSIFVSLNYVTLPTFAKDEKFIVVDPQWT